MQPYVAIRFECVQHHVRAVVAKLPQPVNQIIGSRVDSLVGPYESVGKYVVSNARVRIWCGERIQVIRMYLKCFHSVGFEICHRKSLCTNNVSVHLERAVDQPLKERGIAF